MKVYLVRHASAGKRSEWDGDDRLRPLDPRGFEQVKRINEELRDTPFERILSSPYIRCLQTVEPLAKARGLSVEAEDALAEGAGADAGLALFRRIEADLVASVHGDLLWELLGEKRKKGSLSVLDVD